METLVSKKPNVGRIRYSIAALLFFVTLINYADRTTLSITGPLISKDLGIGSVELGFIFSAFGWAYLIAQIPGGKLLDMYGSKRIYFYSIFFWSLFTLLQSIITFTSATAAIYILFILRFLVGLAEAPSLPANSRIVASWFPTSERGLATAIFNSALYFATVVFTPFMAWIAHSVQWEFVFIVMGGLGIIGSFLWLKYMYAPDKHPKLSATEMAYIRAGGAQTKMDAISVSADKTTNNTWKDIRFLMGNRMMQGVYLGQYCISTLTYFFLTWFPIYLVQERGMSILNAGLVASIPGIFGVIGGLSGGALSDYFLKKGYSLSFARKTPIVIGMLLSMSIIICNYINTEWLIILLMALAFMGKGFGALGWAVMSDTSPVRITGLSGGLFNMCGNISAITTPIVIGFILQATHSFNGVLIFVGLHAAIAIIAFTVIVKEIKRIDY